MKNNVELLFYTEYGNVFDMEDSLYNIEEQYCIGIPEISFIFYNSEFDYYLCYHYHLDKVKDSLVLDNGNSGYSGEIEKYWNNEKCNNIVEAVKGFNKSQIINYILDEMDNFNIWLSNELNEFEKKLNEILNTN